MPNAIAIAKGTKELIPVDVIDRSGIVTDLSTLSPKYDFLDDASTFIYNQATASATGMTLYCLIDASATGPGGLLAVAHYRLFVGFTVGSEKPRIGPVDVYIRDTT